MISKDQRAENLQNFEFTSWEDLIESLASGELPVLDTMLVRNKQISQDKDFEGYINQSRASRLIMTDLRVLNRLHEELTDTIHEHYGVEFDDKKFERNFGAKDGERLFDKLSKMQAETYGEGPSLITGNSFTECLTQYQLLCGYVEELWDTSRENFGNKNYPIATFFSILAIEEIGKLGRIWNDLMAWDRPSEDSDNKTSSAYKNHHKKHFLGVIPGTLINARLDRLIGEKRIKSILEDVESGKIENLRQSCLYIDFKDGRSSLPKERIDIETAKLFVILSGELWMEVLGHFPWEFERMLKKVKSAEIEIGISEELVSGI